MPYYTWECPNCGFLYSEEDGLPDEGIEAKTRFEDLPDDWCCPNCGTEKSQFRKLES